MTPLHIAAGFGHSHVVRTLLAAGASPSLPGPGGLLPIHLAAVADQVAAARLLLEAAPHTAVAMDDGGDTPAYHAAMHGCVAALRLLLQTAPQGALIKRHNVGELPLHAAASQGHDEAVGGTQTQPCRSWI